MFSFSFCSATGPAAGGTQTFTKRAVSSTSGSQEATNDSWRRASSPLSFSSPLASFHAKTAQERFAFSCPLCHLESDECPHSAPAKGRYASHAGAVCSTTLPHCGYACSPLDPAGLVPGSLARAPQAFPLAHPDAQARLRDSVRPASPQVSGCPRDDGGQRCPCHARGGRDPAGKGRDRADRASSRHEVRLLQPLLHSTQEDRWVTANPGPACLEPSSAQTPIQDANAQAHFRMHSSDGLVCSDRPEGRVLSCLHSSSTQTVSSETLRPLATSLFR